MFGFLPENDGKTNAAALQKALNARGDVYVDLPGVYALSDTVYIGDDTSLVFCSGAPVQENISFEHIYCQNEIPVLLVSRTPVRHIRFTDCVLNGNRVVLENLETPGIAYPVADIGFDRTTFYGKSQRLADADKGIKMRLSVDNSFADDDFKAEIGGDIEVKKCDISLEKTEYKTVKDSFTGNIAD